METKDRNGNTIMVGSSVCWLNDVGDDLPTYVGIEVSLLLGESIRKTMSFALLEPRLDGLHLGKLASGVFDDCCGYNLESAFHSDTSSFMKTAASLFIFVHSSCTMGCQMPEIGSPVL